MVYFTLVNLILTVGNFKFIPETLSWVILPWVIVCTLGNLTSNNLTLDNITPDTLALGNYILVNFTLSTQALGNHTLGTLSARFLKKKIAYFTPTVSTVLVKFFISGEHKGHYIYIININKNKIHLRYLKTSKVFV